eukprot:1138657-Pelagomonas_calceolata.AAC.2
MEASKQGKSAQQRASVKHGESSKSMTRREAAETGKSAQQRANVKHEDNLKSMTGREAADKGMSTEFMIMRCIEMSWTVKP